MYKFAGVRNKLYTTPMYVRWQSRKRRSSQFGRDRKPETHWRAILVESVRVNGSPTQQHVAYLGGMTDSGIAILHQRCWFWEDVMERLHQLSNRMTEDERAKIEAAIDKRIPRPTREQYDQALADIVGKYGIAHPRRMYKDE